METRLTAAETTPPYPAEAERLYAEIRGLKRALVFANPLYKGYPLLFCKRVPSSYTHMVAQLFGWRARPGGGLFVLEEPGKSLRARCLTADMPLGSFLEPRLSYDGKKIVFSFVDLSARKTFDQDLVHYDDPDEGFYHIWTIDADGRDAKQLTFGSFDDLTPNWLPDGDVVFVSTRRKGYARCFWRAFGRRWHTYALHRMKPNGDDIETLSWHDTNEWYPTVGRDGAVYYARWDYIDRDAVTHQNLWASRPDGANPRAVWGNATPNPQCVFQARQIPESGKFLAVASAHHSVTGGSLIIVDPSVGVDGPEAIERVTPMTPFPETEGWGIPDFYESPFPLSEEFFI
ncbi:MAG: PD40 domain-containing protein, partial [Thermoguttaceae bacterium]|nr:PD40 domain-containing protein [Thermoguttaceae bacterium]